MIPVPGLGILLTGSWGEFEIGVSIVLDIQIYTEGRMLYVMPFTSDHHVGQGGFGTGFYGQRHGLPATTTFTKVSSSHLAL